MLIGCLCRTLIICYVKLIPILLTGTQIASVQGGIRGCGDSIYPGIFIRLDDPAVFNFITTNLESQEQAKGKDIKANLGINPFKYRSELIMDNGPSLILLHADGFNVTLIPNLEIMDFADP